MVREKKTVYTLSTLLFESRKQHNRPLQHTHQLYRSAALQIFAGRLIGSLSELWATHMLWTDRMPLNRTNPKEVKRTRT